MKRTIQTEIRQCKHCGEDYDWCLRNQLGLCKSCRQKEYNRKAREKFEKKDKYPLSAKERVKRWNKIKSALNKCKTREERSVIYQRELAYIIEVGIFQWCNDLRSPEDRYNNIGKMAKKGRPRLDMFTSKAPDTRGIYE